MLIRTFHYEELENHSLQFRTKRPVPAHLDGMTLIGVSRYLSTHQSAWTLLCTMTMTMTSIDNVERSLKRDQHSIDLGHLLTTNSGPVGM